MFVFRAVAVVVDPIQSVKGKVVIDAFRLINPNMMVRTAKLWVQSIAGCICIGAQSIVHFTAQTQVP